MLPYFNEIYGNPSSVHVYGQQAEAALDAARETVAGILNCHRDEVIFTSCGSESDNLALRGVALAAGEHKNAKHILISPVEHHAVSRTAEQLADVFGFEVEYLPVDCTGYVSPGDVASRLRSDTALVSVIYANNEIGTLNPIAEIGAICRERGVPFHTDAVQAGAYLTLDVEKLNIDLLSIGAHKFYGPKGIGALYARKDTSILPIITGGSQERGLRAGTSNIPLIVGLAEALRLASNERESRVASLLPLRDEIITSVLSTIPDAELTGHPEHRLPNHASFVFGSVDGNLLLSMLDNAGFACSSGSACKTGDPEPSEVLLALGYPYERAYGSLRVTLGRSSNPDNIRSFLTALPDLIEVNRRLVSQR
jgi:cysteine desulfurase